MSAKDNSPSRFSLGQIVATPGSLEAMENAHQNPAELLRRHVSGDWGDVCQEDRETNDVALKEGLRVMSVYKLATGATVWIITEADRSVTTILLPDEY